MARHLITGTDQGDNLVQQDDRDDLVRSYGGFDNINTGAGNDVIYAGADIDYAIAGDGDDKAYGGDGADFLNGGAGNDTLRGEAGSDVLLGGAGIDWLYGGDDGDSLYSNLGPAGFEEKHLFGGGGNDRLVFTWNDFGEAGGGDGYDELDLTLYDEAGPPWAGVSVAMAGHSGTATLGLQTITFTGIEVLRLKTWVGDDTVVAGAGNDTISVHLGANEVDAGAGDDLVTWHTGSANVLEGGLGTDTLEVVHAGAAALVFSAAGGGVSDFFGSTLTGFEEFIVRGGDLGDQAVLGTGADQFFGWRGDDAASGGDGRDWLMGQLGNDSLQGDNAADALNGGYGDDLLDGGTGNDTLTGGLGSDALTGGAGADRFRFTSPEQYFDHITDFTVGVDKLVFYRSLLGLTSNDDPSDPGFLAYNTPDAAHAQFVFFQAGSSSPSELRWDADGTGISGGITIAILDGVDNLTTADFLLLG